MNKRNRRTDLITNSTDGLWDRLVAVLKQDPKDQISIAKEMDISLTAYKGFINGLRTSNFKTLSKIENYVIRREKELNGMD